jgi:hypothetical protein
MTNQIRRTKDEGRNKTLAFGSFLAELSLFRSSIFVLDSSFEFRSSNLEQNDHEPA